MQGLAFCDCLISLCVAQCWQNSSVLLHIAEFSFFKSWVMFYCIHHIFFLQSSVVGHFTCSHILAIVNNASVNLGVLMCLQDPDFSFLGNYPEV